jgi:GT2 family glycosyltransferase
VGIVVVNYNGMDDTLKCLDSLKQLTYPNCFSLVVDNGSTPPAAREIELAHPWTTVVQRATNGGWAGGNNDAIRIALARGAKYIVLLNNDTAVAPDLVGRLVRAAESTPANGILGPLVCWMDEPEKVMMEGCFFNDARQGGFFTRPSISIQPSTGIPRVAEVEIVYGCCMMVSAVVFQRIGLLDERFFLIHEESEFCLRACRAGFHCGVVPEALVWHKGSSSFQRDPRPLQRYFDARNLYLILRKHAANYRNGQPPWQAWMKYLRHVYYMYCLQRDKGNDVAAEAVLEGVADALSGRYGPPSARRRPVLPLLRTAFSWFRTWSYRSA